MMLLRLSFGPKYFHFNHTSPSFAMLMLYFNIFKTVRVSQNMLSDMIYKKKWVTVTLQYITISFLQSSQNRGLKACLPLRASSADFYSKADWFCFCYCHSVWNIFIWDHWKRHQGHYSRVTDDFDELLLTFQCFNCQIRSTFQSVVLVLNSSPSGQIGRHFGRWHFREHFCEWKVHWSLFLRAQLTITQHWFR